MKLELWQEAIEDLDEAIRLAPENPGLYKELALALIASQQWEEAARCFERLVDLQP